MATAIALHDPDLRRLLSRHYGDGAIYLDRRGADAGDGRGLLERAKRAGLVSGDGFITRAGRRYLAYTELMTPPWVS